MNRLLIALDAAKKTLGTVPILRSPRSKMGLSPSSLWFFGSLLGLTLAAFAPANWAADSNDEGFTQLFNGKNLDGWKVGDHAESFSVKDGAIVAHGDVAHLFYVADGNLKPFVNFELRVDVKTEPNSNGGIYFHTKYQEKSWPQIGFEAQVNNTYEADFRKTGSLYRVVDVKEKHVPDNEWYTETVIVKGKHVTIKINDKVVVDYEEPADKKPDPDCTRLLDKGTFALQAHDPKSTVYFKNIRVKRLD